MVQGGTLNLDPLLLGISCLSLAVRRPCCTCPETITAMFIQTNRSAVTYCSICLAKGHTFSVLEMVGIGAAASKL